MPTPEVLALVERFRRLLLALDATLASDLVQAYGPIWRRIKGDLDALLLQVENQQLSFAQVLRLQRYETLMAEVQDRVNAYAALANGRITASQRAAVGLSQEGVKAMVDAALPAGIDTDMLTRLGMTWTRMPAEAFEAFVGISGDGSPLARLLDTLGVEASQGVREAIREGIALGRGPRETAALVRNRFGLPLTRSLTLARTETLRAYREASRLQYAANSNVVLRYRRSSARDDRVCEACLALDGREYDTDELMELHPGDRCAMLPLTLSYRDLGLDVDSPPGDESTARDWFQEQSESTQRAMLGNAKWEAWQAGKFELTDMAKVVDNPTWGPTASVKPLKELIGA